MQGPSLRRNMDIDDRIAIAFVRAVELAQTGQYTGWKAIEKVLITKYPDARTALSGVHAKREIDAICHGMAASPR